MTTHFVSLKGKRPQNEDKHDIIINMDNNDKTKGPINFYAVYDGHGGKFVSKYLSENYSKFFTDSRIVYPLKKNYVKKVYNYLQNTLKNKYFSKTENTGSTCLSVIHYMHDDMSYLNVCNTGDSRCVMARNNIAIPLTKDHKPNWPEEKYRIEQLGGDIIFDGFDWRITDLSVSRAFGDISAEPYVTNMPDVFKYKLTKHDTFIIIACDGLWDVMSNQDAVNFVIANCYNIKTNERINKHINIAKKLAEQAITNKSGDNITIIIVFL